MVRPPAPRGAAPAGNQRPAGAGPPSGNVRPPPPAKRRRPSGAEALAALGPAPPQHEAASLRAHPHQEPVGSLPLSVIGLESPLHPAPRFAARSTSPMTGDDTRRSKTSSLGIPPARCQTAGRSGVSRASRPCLRPRPRDRFGSSERRSHLSRAKRPVMTAFPQVLKFLCKTNSRAKWWRSPLNLMIHKGLSVTSSIGLVGSFDPGPIRFLP